MSTLAISSFQPRTFQRPGTTASLRIWFGRNFVTAEGLAILGGAVRGSSVFVDIPCTLDPATKILTIPSFSLPTTNDSSVRTVTASGLLFDSSGAFVDTLFAKWIIPEQLAPSCTFAELEAYNTATNNPPSPSYPTTDQIEVLINNALGTLNNASDVVIGRTLLDAAPANPLSPTAIGLNSRRVTEMYNVKATAIGAIGDGITNDRAALNTLVNTTLQITGAGGDVYFPAGTYLIGSGMTFPSNVRLVFDPRATLKIANGVTVIITGAIDATPYQIFTNATAGLGTVSLSGNKSLLNVLPEWWGATGDGATDDSASLQASINASLTGAYSLQLTVGAIYKITSTLSVVNGTDFKMVAPNPSGALTKTDIKWAGANQGTALLVDRCYKCEFGGFRITDGTPGNGNRTIGVGIDIDDLGAGNISTANYFHDIGVYNATVGIRLSNVATANNELHIFERVDVRLDPIAVNTIGMLIKDGQSKWHTIRDSSFGFSDIGIKVVNGSFQAYSPNFSNNNRDLYIQSPFDSISIYSPQSETAGRFLETESNPNTPAFVNVYGGRLSTDAVNADNRYIYWNKFGAVNFHGTYMTAGTRLTGFQIFVEGAGATSPADASFIGCTFPDDSIFTGANHRIAVFNCLYTDTPGGGAVREYPNTLDYVTQLSITEGAALSVASNTITPTAPQHQVGAGLIKTITVPTALSSGTIVLVPTAAFTYDATGNILGTGTAVIGRTMFATYSLGTGKWSMSY